MYTCRILLHLGVIYLNFSLKLEVTRYGAGLELNYYFDFQRFLPLWVQDLQNILKVLFKASSAESQLPTP